jgi:hypothetical protein
VVSAFGSPSTSSGAAVLFLPFSWIFARPGENPREKEVKYLAAAGNSGLAGATA